MARGRGVGVNCPLFLLRRGELLHPSDLVQQLSDEVLEGEEHIIRSRKDSDGGRVATGAELTSVGLKQSTRRSCEKHQHDSVSQTLSRFSALSPPLDPTRPTLTLAPLSTSLGMSSSSSTSISSSGMASSWTETRKLCQSSAMDKLRPLNIIIISVSRREALLHTH